MSAVQNGNHFQVLSTALSDNFNSFNSCYGVLSRLKDFHPLDDESCKTALAEIIDAKGRTILMEAVSKDATDLAGYLIEGNIGLERADSNGNTVYHTAAKCGKVEMLLQLFKIDRKHEKNLKGSTPLLSSIKKGHYGAVASLLANGADPKDEVVLNGKKVTALGLATVLGDLNCVKALARGQNFQEHTTEAGSLLHLAIEHEKNGVLEYLLTLVPMQPKDYLEVKDFDGNTPFALAVLKNNPEVLPLLKLAGSNVHARNKEEYQPIHLAAMHNPGLIKQLYLLGSSPISRGGIGVDRKLPFQLLNRIEHPDEYRFINELLLDLVNWNFKGGKNYAEDFEKARLWKLQAKKFVKEEQFKDLPRDIQGKILYHLGEVSCELFEFSEAHQYLKDALLTQQSVFGEMTFETVLTLSKVGDCYLSQGNYSEAKEKYRQVLNIKKGLFGERNVDVARSLYDIARCSYFRGDISKTIKKLGTVLEIQEEMNAPPLDKAATLNLMGQCYSAHTKEKDLNLAESKYQEALERVKKESTDPNPLAVDIKRNMGISQCFKGEYTNGMTFLDDALDESTNLFGNEHPNTAIILSWIGVFKCYQGNSSAGQKKCNNALTSMKKFLGDRHIAVAKSRYFLGICHQVQGQNAKALEEYLKACEIQKEVLGDRHQVLGETLSRLANVYMETGDDSKAVEKFMEAYEIQKVVLGERHQDVATTLSFIGICYTSMQDYREAIDAFNQFIDIWEDFKGEQPLSLAQVIYNLGYVYLQQKKYDDALEYFLKAHDIRLKVYGQQDAFLAQTSAAIQQCTQNLGVVESSVIRCCRRKVEPRCTIL